MKGDNEDDEGEGEGQTLISNSVWCVSSCGYISLFGNRCCEDVKWDKLEFFR